MHLISCILLNDKKQVLLVRKNNTYVLPNFKIPWNVDINDSAENYLFKTFELSSAKKNNLYYCENSESVLLFNETFDFNIIKNIIKKDTIWIDIGSLKDFLKQTPNKNLIFYLNFILKSDFSFTTKERENLMNELRNACLNNDHYTGEYLTKKYYYKVTCQDNLIPLLDEAYHSNKSLNDIDQNIKLEDLTLTEAKAIDKESEWLKLFNSIYKYIIMIPPVPGDEKIDYYDEELKFENRSDFTPKIIKNLITRYAGWDYEKIKNYIIKRRNK